MSSVERYGENGEIIYAVEGGPLKNLWKYMSFINNETREELKEEQVKFDYNEFFKRLYLSRAELDVTNSVLELLLKEGIETGDHNDNVNSNISIEAIQHENDLGDFNINNTKGFGVKMGYLKEISKDLRKTSEFLSKNREEEHEIVSNVLLELREKFRWNLVRISNPEQQVQVTLTGNPIIGIDYSPKVLFKNGLKGEPQYNYNFQVGHENLALVYGHDLNLLFQSKHLEKSTVFSIKNLKTQESSSIILYNQKFKSKTNFLNLLEWDEALKEARNQSIALNILNLLTLEASKYPQDQVLLEGTNLKIVIENTLELSFTDDEPQGKFENFAQNIYKQLLSNYFSSSGKELKWEQVRNTINQK